MGPETFCCIEKCFYVWLLLFTSRSIIVILYVYLEDIFMNIIHDKGAGGVLYYIINEITGRTGINMKKL